MRNVLLLGLALMLAVAIMPGCGSMDPEESSDSSPTLTDDYGGFTTEDESPGFGDSDLLAAFPEDPQYDDEIRDHPQVVDARNRQGAKHYMLRIIWGNLAHPDSTAEPSTDCPVTDWSGSLEVHGGVAVIQRLIRFDLGDEIVRRRSNAHLVEWISYTQPDLDGILFHIIDPPRSDSAAGNSVTLTTPFCTVEIPMVDLADHREFLEFDQCNKLSIVATEVPSGGLSLIHI